MAWIGPGWLIALDAASFAFLGIQAWHAPTGAAETDQRLRNEWRYLIASA
jgi:hypothetical protein